MVVAGLGVPAPELLHGRALSATVAGGGVGRGRSLDGRDRPTAESVEAAGVRWGRRGGCCGRTPLWDNSLNSH